jgi:hypothetical protein
MCSVICNTHTPLLNGPSATVLPSGQQPNLVSSHLIASGLGFFVFLLHFFTFCSLVIATSIGLGVVPSLSSVNHLKNELHITSHCSPQIQIFGRIYAAVLQWIVLKHAHQRTSV